MDRGKEEEVDETREMRKKGEEQEHKKRLAVSHIKTI